MSKKRERIRGDAAVILGSTLTAFIVLAKFPDIFFEGQFWHEIFDVIGYLCVYAGVLLRINARGVKAQFSRAGDVLVTQGPYAVTRNPMYLATFLIGLGMFLCLFPIVFAPVFAGVFLMRFHRQIRKEEHFLAEAFPEAYPAYCRQVPRFFPRWTEVTRLYLGIPSEDIEPTRERRLLIIMPVLILVFELLEEKTIWPSIPWGLTLGMAAVAAGASLFYLLWTADRIRKSA